LAKIIVIVPAYNESGNIDTVVADIRAHAPSADVVVIDDCSVDDTKHQAKALGANVISLPTNLGIGGAVQTGLIYARDNGYQVAVQFDGDGQHMGSQISKILAPVISGQSDVCVGSRFLQRGAFTSSFFRVIGIYVIRTLITILVRQKLTDNTSGFRAYNRKAIEFLSQCYPQDYPEPESIIELSRNGFSILEVGVTMRPRTKGRSSISSLSAFYYMTKVVLAILISYSRKPTFRR
jgi:glycosyltransferase involved in cell wall biosynthesis